jgi:hypothetical protein
LALAFGIVAVLAAIAVRSSTAAAEAETGDFAAALVGQDLARPFVVAVVEAGGLVPVARFTGSQWLDTWPAAVDTTHPDLPLSEAPFEWVGGPIPRVWYVWFTNGKRVVAAATSVDGGGSGGGGCTFSRSIRLAARLVPPRGLHDELHPGVAVDDTRTVDSVHRLDARSRSISSWTTRAKELFVRHEKGAVEGTGWLQPEQQLELLRRLPAIPISVDWMFRTGNGPNRTYYFEAAKWAEGEGGWFRVVVSGWLFDSAPDRFTLALAGIDPGMTPPSLGDTSVSSYVPLGVLTVQKSKIWLVEIPTGETTSYALLHVEPGRLVQLTRTAPGGC